jgi:two-component system chemotaxis response regulator CheB
MMSSGLRVARILICDDSPSFARALTLFLEQDADVRVVGSCTTAEEAIAAIPRLRPDLVTMDLTLPGMDGVEAVRKIVAVHAVPVLVLSGYIARGSERAAAALGAGALEAYPKGELSLTQLHSARAIAFRRRVRRLAITRGPRQRGAARTIGGAGVDVAGRRASVVAICASTGGPPALEAVLAELPADYPLPVLVVQHMSPGFLDGLIAWLDPRVRPSVQRAPDSARARPGVWFAPEGAHLVLDGSHRMIHDAESISGYHRPAADMLFTSVAAAVGRRAVSVVLTGMGSDGAEGTGAVRSAGGLTIAQDQATSAIFGMPRAAAEQGAELILPPDEIGRVLRRLGSVAGRA